MPVRETNAQLVRRPTMALLEAGWRIEPKVSEPRPTTPKLAASPDPVPPEDPPVAWGSVVGISRKTGEHGINVVEAPARPFGHRRFGEDDSAGGPDPGYH